MLFWSDMQVSAVKRHGPFFVYFKWHLCKNDTEPDSVRETLRNDAESIELIRPQKYRYVFPESDENNWYAKGYLWSRQKVLPAPNDLTDTSL